MCIEFIKHVMRYKITVIESVKQFDTSCSYGFLSLFYAEEDKNHFIYEKYPIH